MECRRVLFARCASEESDVCVVRKEQRRSTACFPLSHKQTKLGGERKGALVQTNEESVCTNCNEHSLIHTNIDRALRL